MRRRHVEEPAWPRWLAEYRAQDWPATACHPECAYWDARRVWSESHPEVPTPLSVGPDTPFHREQL